MASVGEGRRQLANIAGGRAWQMIGVEHQDRQAHQPNSSAILKSVWVDTEPGVAGARSDIGAVWTERIQLQVCAEVRISK